MTKRVLATSRILGALLCAGASAAQAADLSLKDDVRPSAYIIELGGYGVFEPSYEGSKRSSQLQANR